VNICGECIALIDFLELHELAPLFTTRINLFGIYLTQTSREELKEKLSLFNHLLDKHTIDILDVKEEDIISFY